MRTRRMRFFGLLVSLVVALGTVVAIPWMARRLYGRPAERLNPLQVLQYSSLLLWADGQLTVPLDSGAAESAFEVLPGESIVSVCTRLEQAGHRR